MPEVPALISDEPKRRGHLFGPGNVGNPRGRPIGVRNRFTEAFLKDMFASWQEHGAQAIEDVRQASPQIYLKVMAGLMCRRVNIKVSEHDDLSDEQLSRQLAAVLGELAAAGIDPFAGGKAAERPDPAGSLSALP